MNRIYVCFAFLIIVFATGNAFLFAEKPTNELKYNITLHSVSSDCLEISAGERVFREIGNADMDGFWEPGENATLELNLANFCEEVIESPGVDLGWDDDILACGTDTCHPTPDPPSGSGGDNSGGGSSGGGSSGGGSSGGGSSGGGTYGSSETGGREDNNQFNDVASFEKILPNRMIKVNWDMHITEDAESDVFITIQAKVIIENCQNNNNVECPDSEITFDVFIGVTDDDNDGVKDDQDLCRNTPLNQNVNSQGCPDSDGDGIFDNFDKCPNANDLIDLDNDEIPDACDDFIDQDGDGIVDSEDICPEGDDLIDLDNDEIPDACDDFIDQDGDGIVDSEDICPEGDDLIDLDNDEIPDACDDFIDQDGDGIVDSEDICPEGDDLIDLDNDEIPDACDDFIDQDGDGIADSNDACDGYDDNIDIDNDGVADGCDPNIDFDLDNIPDLLDLCPQDFATYDSNGDGCQDLEICIEEPCNNILQATEPEGKKGVVTILTMKIAAIGVTAPTIIMVGYVCSSETVRFPMSKRWWAVSTLMLGIKRESGEFQRGRILGFLSGSQGAHVALIKKILNLSNGQMSHHLSILEKEGLVWSVGDGRKLRYYTHHIKIDNLESLPKPPLQIINGSTQHTILLKIEENEENGITLSQISNELKRTPSLINYHISSLYSSDYITSQYKKFTKIWLITQEGKAALIDSDLIKNIEENE